MRQHLTAAAIAALALGWLAFGPARCGTLTLVICYGVLAISAGLIVRSEFHEAD